MITIVFIVKYGASLNYDKGIIRYIVQVPLETTISTAFVTFSSLCGIILYAYLNSSNPKETSTISVLAFLFSVGFIVVYLSYIVENKKYYFNR